MKNSKEMLSTLLKITQTGQTGIRSVLDLSMEAGLRSALHSQLREYDAIENEVHAIAGQRGWELRELDPTIRFLTDRVTRFRLSGSSSDSRIAGILIRDNTKGIIRGLRDFHRYPSQDQRIQILTQKLLDCENAGIQRFQSYL